MTLIKLDDESLEKKIIACELKDKRFFKALNADYFAFAISKKVQLLMNEFFHKYSAFPTFDSVSRYTKDLEIQFYLKELSVMPVVVDSFSFYLDELYSIYLKRFLLNEAKDIVENIQSDTKSSDIVRKLINKCTALKHPISVGEIQRGWGYEVAKKVWEEYADKEKHPEKYKTGISYGITELDKYTNGGTRKGHIILIYGDTGGGKTMFKSNLAYNMAQAGKKVMYISVENPLESIVKLWLSRASLLDNYDIDNTKLSATDREYFKETCRRIYKEKNLPYVVWWTGTALSTDLQKELDLFVAQYGERPEVIFFDYANEMYPTKDWNNSSERFNFLFSELRQFTSSNEVSLITSLQQNRTGKIKKKEEDYGLEDIGQSHYVAPHCHVVLFIKQTPGDENENKLDVYIQKNRYGQKNKKISLAAFWNLGFVGDRARLLQKHSTVAEIPLNTSYDSAYQTAPINAIDSPSQDSETDNNLVFPEELDSSSFEIDIPEAE